MAKSRRVSRKPIYIILALSLVISIAYLYFRPQKVQIMAIDPVPLQFGVTTTISGGLHKDPSGNFVLVLPDRRAVTLNVRGLDSLDGSPVSVTGKLSQDLSMIVSEIVVQKL